MNTPAPRPNSKRWVVVTVAIVILIGSFAGYDIYTRTRPTSPGYGTPAPADLGAPIADINDLEAISSLQEARRYVVISTNNSRKVSDEEFDRVLVLSKHTKHALTSMTAMTAAAACLDQVGDEPAARAKLIGALADNLQSSDAVVRVAAIHCLGNISATDQIALVLPFLKSTDPNEQSAAKLTLEKLGHKSP